MSTYDYRTLLLDSTWRPIRILPWWEAMMLSHADFRGKAQVVSTYDATIRSARSLFEIPAVIALREYHGHHRFKVRWCGRALFKRDGYICQYCGKVFTGSSLTVDHVVPRAQGGKSTWENTVTACRPCNEVKADRTPKQARMPLLHKPRMPIAVGLARFAGEAPPEWDYYLSA